MVKFREIAVDQTGKLYLHSMPGRNELWDEAARAIKQYNIHHILCLNSNAEIHQKSPEYGAFLADALAVENLVSQITQISIEDFSIPVDIESYTAQINLVAQSLAQGEHILIHCAAGIGRTGCAAIALLQELGMSASESQSKVLAAGSNPETDEQWGFIRAYQPKGLANEREL